MPESLRRLLITPLLLVAPVGALASGEAIETSSTPIVTALTSVDADVRTYNDHLTTLASPYMGGRVPGSPGMERAKDYVQFWFEEFGLEAPFADASGAMTYRQEMELGGTTELKSAGARFSFGDDTMAMEQETQFIATSLGESGEATGEMVFVGYSVQEGPDGYTNYEGLDDLEGKIAVMLRFEPMDEEGRSRFQGGSGWTSNAGFRRKLRAAFDRGAAGAIIINPPGSADERAQRLSPVGGGQIGAGPVVMLSQDAGDALMRRADPQGRSLMEMREWADVTPHWSPMRGEATIEAVFEREPLIAENVGGMIPGRGALAEEIIVVGAHLDHLGMGYFGSRSGPGELHPGADDNASGSAGILLLAEKVARSYAALEEDAEARSVLVIAFTGEESGLNGSRFYANNPIRAIEDHAVMINFDMIGRIQNDRVSISGLNTGEGMAEFVTPLFEPSGLEVVVPERMSGASDHTSFYNAGVPVIFAIIADFHDDYHTPADTSEKINRVGATKTVRLFHDIIMKITTHGERFAFARQEMGGRPGGGGGRANINVRFGVQPGYVEGQSGVVLESVSPGTSAGEAGVEAGDVLVRWDGKKVEDIQSWMGMLAEHEPGDEVKVGVLRDGEELTLNVTLQGR